MGKICPQCGYHFPDEATYQWPPPIDCQHDWQQELLNQKELTSNADIIKWRCKKCLGVKYTYD